MMAKASHLPADALLLDLEGAVPPQEKPKEQPETPLKSEAVDKEAKAKEIM
jgi:citrate lyase beta subunit